MVTDDNGAYMAVVRFGWSGIVTPARQYWRFSPESRTYSELNYEPDRQDFGAADFAGVSGGSGGCFIGAAE